MTSVKEILLKVNLIHLEDQLKLYLYGDTFINIADNKKILLSTIKYIKETQRFSTLALPLRAPILPPLNLSDITVIIFLFICMCVLFYTIFCFY